MFAVVVLLLASVPPLTSEQQVRLETARDGSDHREEAFLALAEHVATWDGSIGDTPIRLDPDLAAMIATPSRFRGDLCRLTGVIQQRAALAAPYDVAEEWFLRDDDGQPMAVYVVDRGDFPVAAARSGRRVSIAARFYKRVSFVARDGVEHDYPAFVGASPRLVGRGDAGVARVWIVAVPVVVMLGAFVVLLVYTRRRRPQRAENRRRATMTDETTGPELPDDPSDALAELRRRAEG